MEKLSLSRNRILELARLGVSSPARDEAKLVLVEGYRAIAGAMSSGAKFENIFAVNVNDERLQGLDTSVIEIDEKTAKKIATTTNPQGAIGICEMPVFNPESLLEGELFNKPVIVLDNVSDPGNVGTIIRSAGAFGIGAIVMVGGCDPFHPKVVRSSAGMIFGTPIASVEPYQLEKILDKRQVYKAEASKDSELQTIDFPKNPAIAFGSEANGFQTSFFEDNALSVSINMEESCESLNVAMTATIIAYHLSTLQK